MACLLQVVENKTEDLGKFPKMYLHDVKNKGNLFKKAIDSKLDQLYGGCGDVEIEQGMDLINLIQDKVDEVWELYLEKLNEKKI